MKHGLLTLTAVFLGGLLVGGAVVLKEAKNAKDFSESLRKSLEESFELMAHEE